MPGKRLELSQGCPHNDLNVTRIPFRHPGLFVSIIQTLCAVCQAAAARFFQIGAMMPKFSFRKPVLKAVPAQVGGAWRLWGFLKSLSVSDIAAAAERPFHLALIGDAAQTEALQTRLAHESPLPRETSPADPADVRAVSDTYSRAEDAPPGSLLLHADLDEAGLATALAGIVTAHPDLRIALARRVPAFRPASVSALIAESAKENAKIALLSALPGVVPATAFLLPATALGDMVVLTKNQAMLLLQIAAAYGKEVDLRARTRELLPVVGSAFGWRAAARELIGLVPGGIGLVVKGSIAYAGTYTVGRAAAIYYSTGHTLTASRLRQLYKDAYREAGSRVRPLLAARPSLRVPLLARLRKKGSPPTPNSGGAG